MAYKSLLSRAYNTPNGSRRVNAYLMRYYGNVGSLIDSTSILLSQERDYVNDARLAFRASHIVNSIIDSKIESKRHGSFPVVKQAIDASLSICMRQECAHARLMDLKDKLYSSCPEVLKSPYLKDIDHATWESSFPGYSRNTANDLAKKDLRHNILFIALGHGGVASGMDVYNMYCDARAPENADFYACRYSRFKKADLCPMLDDSEIDWLKNNASGRQVILYDEDSASGKTMDGAKAYFGDLFSKEVLAVTNYGPYSVNNGY